MKRNHMQFSHLSNQETTPASSGKAYRGLNLADRRLKAACSCPDRHSRSQSRRKTSVRYWGALRTAFVLVTLLGCLLPGPVWADPNVSIWLYNSQGILVNDTSITTYNPTTGYVCYTANGVVIGLCSSQDPHIYDIHTGTVVGIIETQN